MKNTMLEAAISAALVEIISRKIVERLTFGEKRALVLFDTSDFGIDDTIKQLTDLKVANWCLEIADSKYTTDSMSSKTRETLSAIPNFKRFSIESVDQIASMFDELPYQAPLIVPNMSLTLAAKLATGISDDIPSRFMSHALEQGRPVIATKDGCCPSCRERTSRGFYANDAYRAMMAGHLVALQNYGVRLCWARSLAATVRSACQTIAPSITPILNSNISSSPSLHQTSPSNFGERRVFGWSEAKQIQQKTVEISRETVITPLALEELKARNIRVIRQ